MGCGGPIFALLWFGNMTAQIGHQQGQVLKELFVPGADNGPKTGHLRWRCAIADRWHGDETVLEKFVKLLEETWLQVQRLYPAKDWRAFQGP